MAGMMALVSAVGAKIGTVAAGAGAQGVGTLLSLGGTLMSARAQAQAGSDAVAVGEYNARREEEQAQAERASAIQEANEERRQGRLLRSRALAVGAASGGGIDVENLADIETESERRARLALWGGEERARGRESSAVTTRLEANAQAGAARNRATGTLISGGVSWMDKYAPRNQTLT